MKSPFFLLAFGALAAAGCSAADSPPTELHHFDLRGRSLPAQFRIFGPLKTDYLHPEPEGLRVTLPKDRADLKAVGIDLPTSVSGDFEITATIDIIEAEKPVDDNQAMVGVFLAVNQIARVGRLMKIDGPLIAWERVPNQDGTRRYLGRFDRCPENVRRLRVTRTGSVLHFLWSPEVDGDNLREIGQCEFGTDDITLVRLRLNTGEQDCRLDVRISDLRITGPRATPSRPQWVTPVVGTVAVVLVLSVLMVIRRRMRKPLAA